MATFLTCLAILLVVVSVVWHAVVYEVFDVKLPLVETDLLLVKLAGFEVLKSEVKDVLWYVSESVASLYSSSRSSARVCKRSCRFSGMSRDLEIASRFRNDLVTGNEGSVPRCCDGLAASEKQGQRNRHLGACSPPFGEGGLLVALTYPV